jgi:sugar phosphate isomerase/epimerase
VKIGVATFGMGVWEGGTFDFEQRLKDLRKIGYEGVERLPVLSASDAVQKAFVCRRLGMDYATVAGPDPQSCIEMTAAFGKPYVWTAPKNSPDVPMDVYCRQVNMQIAATDRVGIRTVLHTHMGTVCETQEQLEEFLAKCPRCGLLLDTAHLAGPGGDNAEIIRKYRDRLVAVHVKDYFLKDPSAPCREWWKRGDFCPLGKGNIGLNNKAIVKLLLKLGYDGWIFVEQDQHYRDPLKDLAWSRKYLKAAGV